MKKILLAVFYLIGLLSPAFVRGQESFSFTSSPSDTINFTYAGPGSYNDNITNTSGNGSPIKINWHVINTDFPPDWLTDTAFGFCDNNTCYNNSGGSVWNGHTGTSYTSNQYLLGAAGTFGLSLNLSYATSSGCHWMKVGAAISGSIGGFDTVTFIVCKAPTAVPTVANPESSVVLYPNPAHDELNVVYDAGADVKTIAVYNIIGKVMAIYKVTDNSSANLNLENLPSGLYFARLVNSHGDVIVTRKFTKQ